MSRADRVDFESGRAARRILRGCQEGGAEELVMASKNAGRKALKVELTVQSRVPMIWRRAAICYRLEPCGCLVPRAHSSCCRRASNDIPATQERTLIQTLSYLAFFLFYSFLSIDV
jgi:hypothetical protein